MEGSNARRLSRGSTAGALLLSALSLAVAGCGGARQDASEPRGDFTVSVPSASFPLHQTIAQPAMMSITVRNDGTKTVPDVAVSVDSFNYVSQQPGLADPNRPIWIIDSGPTGGLTSYVSTWALGRLAPRASKTFTWRVTAIHPGSFTVHYRIAAGLNGKAVARLADGSVPQGTFNVRISGRPPQASVNPQTGAVVTH